MKKVFLISLIGVLMSGEVLTAENITIAGGCFWCVEGVYSSMKGVTTAISGYANGKTQNPTYKEVCTGATGYAEAVQISYNPKIVKLEKILEVFWRIHDPTTLNRQGVDTGTQYRSGIYYENEAQKKAAETSKAEAQKKFGAKIVTEIEPLKIFHKAEEYHQNYFAKNPTQGYCQAVVAPKIEKFRESFRELAR